MDADTKDDIDGSVCFSRVSAVVTGWTFDFMFVSLCRRFKEGKLDEFNDTLSTFEGVSKSPSLKEEHAEKTLICAFLARVLHGKQLDVQFEEDTYVMPLMSAAKIWSTLENTVADESSFKTITILLLVQSVAVCLEKGKKSSASSALRWFENKCEFPQNVKVKLSAIVRQNETYHPFLLSFSFSRLLETVQSYLDDYLKKNPSDYLLKTATEMVRSSHSTERLENIVAQDDSPLETSNKSAENRRIKKKLLSTKINDWWNPETCKKPFVSIKRIPQNELFQMISKKSLDTSSDAKKQRKGRKTPEKWTSQLDKYLEDGVKRHGQGKWSRIYLIMTSKGALVSC